MDSSNRVYNETSSDSYQQNYQYQNQNQQQQYDNNNLYEYDNSNEATGRTNRVTDRVKEILAPVLSADGMANNSNNNDKRSLIIPKLFYFFYFGAFGSLLPLLSIYFKQMAMSPLRVGILLGTRPFIEFIAAPFWSHIGDKFNINKKILLVSLLCWTVFNIGLTVIKPPVHSCLMHNKTHIFFSGLRRGDMEIIKPVVNDLVPGGQRVINKRHLLTTTTPIPQFETLLRNKRRKTSEIKFTTSNEEIDNYSTVKDDDDDDESTTVDPTTDDNEEDQFTIQSTLAPKSTKISENYFGASGLDSHSVRSKIIFLNDTTLKFVKPLLQTSTVYDVDAVTHAFYIFWIWIIIGEFVCSPAITIADKCCMEYLGESRAHLYGRQRMFGSLGWGLSMFIVGILLGNS
jgi:hypothetical protein